MMFDRMEALLLALVIFLGSLFSSLVLAMVTKFLDWYCEKDRHLRARVESWFERHELVGLYLIFIVIFGLMAVLVWLGWFWRGI